MEGRGMSAHSSERLAKNGEGGAHDFDYAAQRERDNGRQLRFQSVPDFPKGSQSRVGGDDFESVKTPEFIYDQNYTQPDARDSSTITCNPKDEGGLRLCQTTQR